MKLLKKMTVPFLMVSFSFVSEVLSDEDKATQTLISQPIAGTQSRQSFTPIPTENAQIEKKAVPQVPESEAAKKKKKHKSVATKTKEKAKPVVSTAKETTPPTTYKDTKVLSNTVSTPAGHQGWFVGIRGAYVPSMIVEINYEFNNTFKLRLLGQMGQYKRTYSGDGQRYDHIRFKPQKVGAMADWHPWKNGFRLTGGIAYNADRIRLNHMVTNTLLGLPASVYGTIIAKYKFRVVAPYLGLGYDTGSLGDTGLSLSVDAGFWFQGRVRSSFSLSGTGRNNSMVLENTRDHLNNLLNKHKFIRTMPMISLGLRYLI
jgi:hypothetical protein